MNIGFIGFGEAAFHLSLGLQKEGLSGIYAYDTMLTHKIMGPQIYARAEEAKVTLVAGPSELALHSDAIFAAVPSSFAVDACRSILPYLHKGQLYVDVSASTPATKKLIWKQLQGIGVLFVDAAMMGSLPQLGHRVPITASGDGVAAFCQYMRPYGMQITSVGETAGYASAIKLIRSIFMKGVASLMIESLRAADYYDVTDKVVESISHSLDGVPFAAHLDRLVTGSAVHCRRRAAELSGSIDLLSEAHLPSDMTASAKRTLESLEPFRFAERCVSQKISRAQDVIDVIRFAETSARGDAAGVTR